MRFATSVDAYSATAWAPAFTAIAGYSAALTGLLFVAISINLSQIMKVPGLIPRAIEVLVLLTAVLVLSTLMLMPSQSATTLGTEALAIGVVAEVMIARIQIRASRHLVGITPVGFASRVFGAQLGLVLLGSAASALSPRRPEVSTGSFPRCWRR